MSVMMADVETSEERMVELKKKVNMLLKAVEEMDYEIASLKNHIESRERLNQVTHPQSRIVTKGRMFCKTVSPKI